jgi:hypothetical protein
MRLKEGGICDSDDVCRDVLWCLDPDDRAMVTDMFCAFGRGDRVPTPELGGSTVAAVFIVTSRGARRDMLRVAALLEKEFSMPLLKSV